MSIIRPIYWACALAACVVLGLFINTLTDTDSDLPPIVTLAPTGEIGTQSPLIVWENLPDQKYDVWILPKDGSKDDVEALFATKGVQSPIEFSALKPTSPDHQLKSDEDYRILICYAGKGRIGGTAFPFKIAKEASPTLPTPNSPVQATLAITDLLDKNRPSDALMIIERLPKDIRELTEIQTLESLTRNRIIEAAKSVND